MKDSQNSTLKFDGISFCRPSLLLFFFWGICCRLMGQARKFPSISVSKIKVSNFHLVHFTNGNGIIIPKQKIGGKQGSHLYLATLFSSTSIWQQLNCILKQNSLHILKQNSLHNPYELSQITDTEISLRVWATSWKPCTIWQYLHQTNIQALVLPSFTFFSSEDFGVVCNM